ncbi:hypothetical protein [Terracidiphilus sp.]|uniref:hypothetical protein n=1 Tax=Terracidiphilus sp. TaxID=1964191 RepID=UPI003C23A9BD
MRKFLAVLTGITLIAPMALACPPQTSAQQTGAGSVEHALQNELSAEQDASHPMQYRLRKSSPRLTTTKQMVETRDGQVALLLAVNDAPPSADDTEKEQARLDTILSDPGKQQHRKQSEDAETARAVKVLRILPQAFLYQDAGPQTTPSGATIERYTFTPNPRFNPPDLETTILTQMTGEIWIDPAHQRVTHLEGHLQNDVDFGWGVLGRLYKGGSIAIDQADVGGGIWHITGFQMKMSGRLLFKTRVFDTTEEETHFTPVSGSLDYKQAVKMLRDTQKGLISDSR